MYIYIYKSIKMCKSKIPIIHQEYKRHNNCTQCNNTKEQDDQSEGQQFQVHWSPESLQHHFKTH
jgi:hypothetical protein